MEKEELQVNGLREKFPLINGNKIVNNIFSNKRKIIIGFILLCFFCCFILVMKSDLLIDHRYYYPTWINSKEFIFYKEIKDTLDGEICIYNIEKQKYFLLSKINNIEVYTNDLPNFKKLNSKEYYLTPNITINIEEKTLNKTNSEFKKFNRSSLDYSDSYHIRDNSTIKDNCLQLEVKFSNIHSKFEKTVKLNTLTLINENPEIEDEIRKDVKHSINDTNRILRNYIDVSIGGASIENVFVILVRNKLKKQTSIYIYNLNMNKIIYSSNINGINYRGFFVAEKNFIVIIGENHIIKINKNTSALTILNYNGKIRMDINNIIFGKKSFLTYAYEFKNNKWISRFEIRKYDSLSKATKLFIPNYIIDPVRFYDFNDEGGHIVFTDELSSSIFIYDIHNKKVHRVVSSGIGLLNEKYELYEKYVLKKKKGGRKWGE